MNLIKLATLDDISIDIDSPTSVAYALDVLAKRFGVEDSIRTLFESASNIINSMYENRNSELRITGLCFEDVVQILISNGYDVTAKFSGDQSFKTANDRTCTIEYHRPEIPFE